MISAREHLHHQLLKCCRSHATKMEWWQLIIQAIFCSEWYCWLISLYFTTDHVTRKGNWPIQQVLYLPAFFLVPPLTILTKQCMPFSWFQRLFNVCLIISRHRRTRFSQEEQPIHTRWCMLKCVGELHGPKEINSLKVVWDGAISCHLVDH